MKPIWNGAIGFGLVNIPVKLYSATESSTLDLDMLDKKDLTIQDFTIRNALDRIDKKGDIFSPVLGKGVDLIKALDSINRSKLS
jgi:non-homologous end joining protein Ku